MRKWLSYKKLSAIRPYVIAANLILGALLTTPELLTQICMAVFLQLLFEAAVWIAWFRERPADDPAKVAPADRPGGKRN